MAENQSVLIEISGAVTKIIKQFFDGLDIASRRAMLAQLRHTIGKPLSQSVEIWPWILSNVPENFINKYGEVSYQLQAVINTLQIYSLYEQGGVEKLGDKNSNESEESESKKSYSNMGTTLRGLRSDEGVRGAMDRRFSVMITASDYESFYYYLRQLVRLLKGRTKDNRQAINYIQLARDLYLLQFEDSEKVRLSWAQEYYRFSK
ncbi:type I-E CRISPR-associated protein Cse2/CasB [Gardnerella vaginalis]|uniref:type I-E CRISPR-associated protein Cse2/CasB n=1 Tax=Gardnerella vaginalis TaxID=2702 RepID=UPI000352F81D|nr:type I-E CRISPR-associated protein Cse2/CasB [Gardnerella vaginalis]EPI42421.1 CRISPR system CASCADE complex protein CasB [Gardnerella vaginalis JCP8481B]EPI44036.1 CRISPR system CASCADE complex protein CasB [Gardnerella vaginalis JCP8481A]